MLFTPFAAQPIELIYASTLPITGGGKGTRERNFHYPQITNRIFALHSGNTTEKGGEPQHFSQAENLIISATEQNNTK